MIEPSTLLAWSALALAVTLTPGPDTLLVAGHGARSARAGLAATAGIVCGGVFYIALFGLGLLRVLATTPTLFMAVKVAGALYLAWLGVQLIVGAVRPKPQAVQATRLGAPFRQGLLTNVLNPKVALFYLAALPQFASGPDAPATGALLIAIHYTFGAAWLSCVALAAQRAGALVKPGAVTRWLEGAVGAFFVAVAGRLAWEKA